MATNVSDTPETDAAREVWLFEKPNVVLGDGSPIHDNVVDVRFARRMERQRDEAIARADQAELRMMRAKRERDKAWAARDRLANCIKNSYEVMSLENVLFSIFAPHGRNDHSNTYGN